MTNQVTNTTDQPVWEPGLATWLTGLEHGDGSAVARRLGRVIILGYLDFDGDPCAALDAAAQDGPAGVIKLRQVWVTSTFGRCAALGDGDIRFGGIDAYYGNAAAA